MKHAEQNAHVIVRHEQNARARLPFYYLLPVLIFFLSCTEKKKTIESSATDNEGRDIPVSPKEYPCIKGRLRSVLIDRSPIAETEKGSVRTVIYALGNYDSLTVKLGTCEKPSYEYTYSTKRYYRGIDEVRFYYGAVNSFYLMLNNEHQAPTYQHNDLIEASKVYLAQHKNVTLQYPILFTSDGKVWTYTLEELSMNGERRTMRWKVTM